MFSIMQSLFPPTNFVGNVGTGGTLNITSGGTGLTGDADASLWTIALWYMNLSPTAAYNYLAFSDPADPSTFQLKSDNGSGFFEVAVGNAAFASGFAYKTANTYITDGKMHCALTSFNTNTDAAGRTAAKRLYIDDVSDSGGAEAFNYGAAFSVKNTGATGAPGWQIYYGFLGLLWMAHGTALDFSVTANRRLFLRADMTPADLGDFGEKPLGSKPILYIKGGDNSFRNWGTGGSIFSYTGGTAWSQPIYKRMVAGITP